MREPKWIVWNGFSQEDWAIALEATKLHSNWLDYAIGWIPPLAYYLWQARIGAFCAGMEYVRKHK